MTFAKRDCQCALAHHRHGETATYTHCGCRCFPCRVAYSEYLRQRRHGEHRARRVTAVPRVGTRRRIEALHAIGWSGAQLAELLGVSFQNVYGLRASDKPVLPGTARKVADLYDRLWDKPPTGHPKKTINWAKRMGFAPPLAWDDDTIDDPEAEPATGEDAPIDDLAVDIACTGRKVTLTSDERLEVIRRLAARGHTAGEIGRRLGTTKNNVSKIASRNGISTAQGAA